MIPGINPKKMQAMMKQLGIQQQEIDASRVIIECEDKDIVIENPSVTKVNMQGQETFQIAGEAIEKEKGEIDESESFNDEDIKTIMEKTGCTEEQAKASLEKTNDLAESIMELS